MVPIVPAVTRDTGPRGLTKLVTGASPMKNAAVAAEPADRQALLLFNVGDKELTAGELRTRGYYLGSNVSYNLKKLVEMGFLDHQRSRVDRRSVRIRLTAQGQEIRRIVDALYQKHVKTVEQVGGISNEEFASLNKSLHRLERFWTDQILYRL